MACSRHLDLNPSEGADIGPRVRCEAKQILFTEIASNVRRGSEDAVDRARKIGEATRLPAQPLDQSRGFLLLGWRCTKSPIA